MKKTVFTIILCTILAQITYAQVGIGTSSPDPSAELDITTTNKGLLIPRMSITGRNGIPSLQLPVYKSTRQTTMLDITIIHGLEWIKLSTVEKLDDLLRC